MSAVEASPRAPRGYHTRLADFGRDREAVIALWQRNLGDPARRAEKFDWFYRDCPYGAPLLILLYHDDTLIGCTGAAPRRMHWRGAIVRAGLLADIAVDADHRTLGPALLLQEALIAAAVGRFDLLYGFPNRKSLPVAARVGYTLIGKLTRYSLVLRYAAYLRRYLPGWLATPLGAVLDRARILALAWRQPRSRMTGEWSDDVDPRMDALWHPPFADGTPLGVRDAAASRWRFDACPLRRTRFLLLAERPAGRLHAWFACQVRGNVLCVCDYWCERGSTHVGLEVAAALVRAARHDGHASISLSLAGGAALVDGWRRAGFAVREAQPVIAKWLAADPPDLNHGEPWFLTEADEDE